MTNMPPRPSLRSFLSLARGKLNGPSASSRETLTFVVGNESADLDSLCSALVLSYLKSNTPQTHIPLANLPRNDLALRSEMAAVLKRAGLTPTDLLTLDDLPNPHPQDTRWLLVDHNALTGPLGKFSPQIVGCIDHHADEDQVPRDADPRIIQKSGSCMSLIVNHCRPAWDALSSDDAEATREVDSQLALIALSAILSDTVGLKAKDKVTAHDEQAVEYLEGKLHGSGYERMAYHAGIEDVKLDISELSFRDIFRKDYKEWTEGSAKLGVCAVVQGFDYLLEKASRPETFIDELGKWAKEKGLDIVSVMTTLRPGGTGFGRELLVWARNEDVVGAVKDFARDSGRDLRLEPFRDGILDGDREWRRAWKQGNLAASRKQVAPMIREAMKRVPGNKI